MIALAIDASTYTGTVGVLRDGALVALETVAMRGVDEERLLPAVSSVLQAAGVAVHALERIYCGAGPGSFTSLRIAASIAKGLATGALVPIHAVPSLALLVASAEATRSPGRYVAALDALRGEHYVAECEVDDAGQVAQCTSVERWPSDALEARARSVGPLVGAGLAIDAQPSVRGLPRLGRWLEAQAPVDLAGWEPDYGRLAEAQVKWEAAHGRPLPAA